MYTQNTTNHTEIAYIFVHEICKNVKKKHSMTHIKGSAVGLCNN
jgi:hypothetical protein